MEANKVLVKEDDVAVVICPVCRIAKEFSVAQCREKNKRILRIKCCCGNIFCICLEFRRHPRKPVKLLGKSINLSMHRENQDMIVRNISLGGIGFSVFNRHRIRTDDLLQVFFDLNDTNFTPVSARAMVRNVASEYIGCEFTATRDFATALGFYLLI